MTAFEEFGFSEESLVMPAIIHNDQICTGTLYMSTMVDRVNDFG